MAHASRILVAVDFSACSRAALDAAVRLAKDMAAEIVLVHAFSAPARFPMGTDPAHPDPITEVRMELNQDEAVELSTTWAAEVRRHGIDVETVAREGKAADVILEEAKRHKAAFIIIGTHGRTGFRHLAFGSVAEAVVRRADRPVLTVPDPKAKPAG